MIPSAKGAIALAAVGGLVAILKMILQARAAREAREAAVKAAAELAELRRESEERAARHAREAADRAEQAAERALEREQKEKVIAELQASNAGVLDFLKAQLKTQQEAGAKRYDIIERNTTANEKLATACADQARELRVLVDRVGRLEGGAGCRIVGNGRPT